MQPTDISRPSLLRLLIFCGYHAQSRVISTNSCLPMYSISRGRVVIQTLIHPPTTSLENRDSGAVYGPQTMSNAAYGRIKTLTSQYHAQSRVISTNSCLHTYVLRYYEVGLYYRFLYADRPRHYSLGNRRYSGAGCGPQTTRNAAYGRIKTLVQMSYIVTSLETHLTPEALSEWENVFKQFPSFCYVYKT